MPAKHAETSPAAAGKKPAAVAHDADKRARAEKQKKEKETARLEKEIETRETALKEVEAALTDPGVFADGPRSKELVKRYESLKRELESLWEKLGELA